MLHLCSNNDRKALTNTSYIRVNADEENDHWVLQLFFELGPVVGETI